MSELTEKVAVVTGGSSGIGRGAVEVLLSQGAAVAFCGIDQGPVDLVLDELGASYGEKMLMGRVADVTDEQAMKSLADDAAEHFGGLDIVVAAAGIQTYGSAGDTDLELWNRTLAVNVTGSYLAIKHALPHLRGRGGGAIVLVSSVQAFVCQSRVASYTASKGALNALARSIAIDEAVHGIRANAVCPASVDTPMLRESARRFSDGTEAGIQAMVNQWGGGHPPGRVARPDEVGEVIAFLASDRASFVSGAAVPVDGGFLAACASVDLPE